MKIIPASYEIIDDLNGADILRKIELCGRVCYKSEDRITEDSAKKFVADIIKRGHESVLEHFSFSVRFIVDRGVSHELVRHRIASFSQESTRYCNYGNDDGGCTFIQPVFFPMRNEQDCRLINLIWADESEHPYPAYKFWADSCFTAERQYMTMLASGVTPQEARSVLPNSLKTEVIMTANLREWRHFFKLRTAKAAHPQMREVTIPLWIELKKLIPVVFDDIHVNTGLLPVWREN